MANTNIYDLSVEERDGSLTSLSSFDGKVLLIVNTATGCGFTPQYEDLERIYAAYKDQGFEIFRLPLQSVCRPSPRVR